VNSFKFFLFLQKKTMQKHKLSFFLFITLLTHNYAKSQCYSCVGGISEGSVNIISNQSWSGDKYFDNLTIAEGVTVTATGTTPLIIHVNGNVTISGTLTAANGVAGGNGGGSSTNGSGPGGGLTGCPGSVNGGGGAYKNAGIGGCGTPPAAYGSDDVLGLPLGSGGGGTHTWSAAAGGYSGGAIAIIACGVITINSSGIVEAVGRPGFVYNGPFNLDDQGGGGSGGTIYLSSGQNSVVVNGLVNVSGGVNTESNLINNGSPGRIRIDGILSGSATLTDIYNPQFFDNTVTSISAINTLCNGSSDGVASVNLVQAGVGYTYLWSNGATTQEATGLPAGNYEVTVTNTNGCSKTVSGTVGQPAVLAANITTTATTATANPTGGTPPYSYEWSNGQIGQTTTGLSTGTYPMTLSDANGCSIEAIFDVGNTGIEELNALNISLSPNPSSDVITLTTDAFTKPSSYRILDFTGRVVATDKLLSKSTLIDISTLAAGTYLILAENAKSKPFVVKR
jgi:hypothetical protein